MLTRSIVIVALACACLLSGSAVANTLPAQTSANVVMYDSGDSGFTATTGGVPAGFDPSSDFSNTPCVYDRQVNNGISRQEILRSNCGATDNGAPSAGDVSVHRDYAVAPGTSGDGSGQYYRAWVKGQINNVHGSFDAKVKIHVYNSSGTLLGECAGIFGQHFDTFDIRNTGSGCAAWPTPKNTSLITFAFRARAEAKNDWGYALMKRIRIARCSNAGDCSSVNPPSSW